jgi:hypothetical protein
MKVSGKHLTVAHHKTGDSSCAIHEAIAEKLTRLGKIRLAQECSKLDPKFEQSLADEGLSSELEEWPPY